MSCDRKGCACPAATEGSKLQRGVKKDDGKPAMDLIDPLFDLGVARVLTLGASKYSKGNWKLGMYIGKALAGVKRHINAIERGEYHDLETEEQHAYHAACGLMFVAYYIRNNVKVPDDRFNEAVDDE